MFTRAIFLFGKGVLFKLIFVCSLFLYKTFFSPAEPGLFNMNDTNSVYLFILPTNVINQITRYMYY